MEVDAGCSYSHSHELASMRENLIDLMVGDTMSALSLGDFAGTEDESIFFTRENSLPRIMRNSVNFSEGTAELGLTDIVKRANAMSSLQPSMNSQRLVQAPADSAVYSSLPEWCSLDGGGDLGNLKLGTQESTVYPARLAEDQGFNFGIETYIHGTELGFGRQPSFKRLSHAQDNLNTVYYNMARLGEGRSTEDEKNGLTKLHSSGEATLAKHKNPCKRAYLFTDSIPDKSISINEGHTSAQPILTLLPLSPATIKSNQETSISSRDSTPPNVTISALSVTTCNASTVTTLDNSSLMRSSENVVPMNDDFKREIDMLIKNLLGGVDYSLGVTPRTSAIHSEVPIAAKPRLCTNIAKQPIKHNTKSFALNEYSQFPGNFLLSPQLPQRQPQRSATQQVSSITPCCSVELYDTGSKQASPVSLGSNQAWNDSIHSKSKDLTSLVCLTTSSLRESVVTAVLTPRCPHSALDNYNAAEKTFASAMENSLSTRGSVSKNDPALTRLAKPLPNVLPMDTYLSKKETHVQVADDASLSNNTPLDSFPMIKKEGVICARGTPPTIPPKHKLQLFPQATRLGLLSEITNERHFCVSERGAADNSMTLEPCCVRLASEQSSSIGTASDQNSCLSLPRDSSSPVSPHAQTLSVKLPVLTSELESSLQRTKGSNILLKKEVSNLSLLLLTRPNEEKFCADVQKPLEASTSAFQNAFTLMPPPVNHTELIRQQHKTDLTELENGRLHKKFAESNSDGLTKVDATPAQCLPQPHPKTFYTVDNAINKEGKSINVITNGNLSLPSKDVAHKAASQHDPPQSSDLMNVSSRLPITLEQSTDMLIPNSRVTQAASPQGCEADASFNGLFTLEYPVVKSLKNKDLPISVTLGPPLPQTVPLSVSEKNHHSELPTIFRTVASEKPNAKKLAHLGNIPILSLSHLSLSTQQDETGAVHASKITPIAADESSYAKNTSCSSIGATKASAKTQLSPTKSAEMSKTQSVPFPRNGVPHPASVFSTATPILHSIPPHRRLSEFKNGGYWYPSFSRSRISVSESLSTNTDIPLSSRQTQGRPIKTAEDLEKEIQRANEERKERVRAFMARRKVEKLAEKQRQMQLDAKHQEQQQREEQRRKIAVDGSKSMPKIRKGITPDRLRERHASPIAAQLIKDETALAGGKTEAELTQSGSTRDTHVRVVVVFAAACDQNDDLNRTKFINFNKKDQTSSPQALLSGCAKTIEIYPKDQTTLQVRYLHEEPRLFNVDEFVHVMENQERFSFLLLHEVRRRFLSGMNAAVLLASTANAKSSSIATVRRLMDNLLVRLPAQSDLFWSMCVIRNGLMEDLLLHTVQTAGGVSDSAFIDNKQASRVAFCTIPLLGVTVEGVTWKSLTKSDQVAQQLSQGYIQSKLYESDSSALVVISLALRIVHEKDGDVIFSSLLFTDAGTNCHIYNNVLRRADQTPLALFRGILCGPTFTVAAFSLTERDSSEAVQLLDTQRKLRSITNRQTHIGSVKRFVELLQKELDEAAKCHKRKSVNDTGDITTTTTTIMIATKMKRLKEQLGLAQWILENPYEFHPGELAERVVRMRLAYRSSDKRSDSKNDYPSRHASTTFKSVLHQDISKHAPHTTAGEAGGGKPARMQQQYPHSVALPKSGISALLKDSSNDAILHTTSQRTVSEGVMHLLNHGLSATSDPCISLTTKLAVGQHPDSSSMRTNLLSQQQAVDRAPLPALRGPSGVGSTLSPEAVEDAFDVSALDHANSKAHFEANAVKQKQSTRLKHPQSKHQYLPGSAAIGPNGGPSWPTMPSTFLGALPRHYEEKEIMTSQSANAIDFFEKSSGHHGGRLNISHVGHNTNTFSPHKTDSHSLAASASTKVRTLVVVDPRCNETSNVTYDNNVVVVTTEDDFEEYEVDELAEMPLKPNVNLVSDILEELCRTICRGCNAAILGADSRSCSATALALKGTVHTILSKIGGDSVSPNNHIRCSLRASIVKLNGKTVVDLLHYKSLPQKLVVAISPIFGSCVHGAFYKSITSSASFNRLLDDALLRATSVDQGKDYGLVFCTLIFKLKLSDDDDVQVCSLVTSFARENVGLYCSVLERSPLVPRALYHYALGGPCYTVAMLGIGSDESRANRMLQVQRLLGQVNNRPTHPGSITRFISDIHNELTPALRNKLKRAQGKENRAAAWMILCRMEEMLKDAELLLTDFDHHQPKAYIYYEEIGGKDDFPSRSDRSTNSDFKTGTLSVLTQKPLSSFTALESRFSLRQMEDAKNFGVTETVDRNRIKSLVCFDRRLLGGGSVATEGNSVLVSTGEEGQRFDSDEVIVRDGNNDRIPKSVLIDELVQKFISGHNTGLLAADSRNCAFTPLILRKIVYGVVEALRRGSISSNRSSLATPNMPITVARRATKIIMGELHVSMALIKDNIVADLLPMSADASPQNFQIEHSVIYGPVINGVTSYIVTCLEEFDQFLATAIDNAEPALQTDDPGIMVVSLILTQVVNEPAKDDVLVSALIATTVFDAVRHYANVLERNANEPLELFRNIIGGSSHTLATVGISDEDSELGDLLTVLGILSQVTNQPSEPKGINKYIRDLQEGIAKLVEHASTSSSQIEKSYIMNLVGTAQRRLHEAERLKRSPFSQSYQRMFVPLGATEMIG